MIILFLFSELFMFINMVSIQETKFILYYSRWHAPSISFSKAALFFFRFVAFALVSVSILFLISSIMLSIFS